MRTDDNLVRHFSVYQPSHRVIFSPPQHLKNLPGVQTILVQEVLKHKREQGNICKMKTREGGQKFYPAMNRRNKSTSYAIK